MNQIEFLGLAHTFATMSPSNTQNILCQTHSKKYLSSDIKILLFEGKCYVIITDLAISLVLTTFGEQAQEIHLCSPDHFSPGGAQAGYK